MDPNFSWSWVMWAFIDRFIQMSHFQAIQRLISQIDQHLWWPKSSGFAISSAQTAVLCSNAFDASIASIPYTFLSILSNYCFRNKSLNILFKWMEFYREMKE